MASQGITVSIQAKIEGWQDQIKQIQNAVKNIKPGTEISKTLTKELSQVTEMVTSLGKNMNQRLTSDSQITNFIDKITNVEEVFNRLGTSMSNISFNDIKPEYITAGFKDLLTTLEQANNALGAGMEASFQSAIGNSKVLQKEFANMKLDPKTMNIDAIREALATRGEALKKDVDEGLKKLTDFEKGMEKLKNARDELAARNKFLGTDVQAKSQALLAGQLPVQGTILDQAELEKKLDFFRSNLLRAGFTPAQLKNIIPDLETVMKAGNWDQMPNKFTEYLREAQNRTKNSLAKASQDYKDAVAKHSTMMGTQNRLSSLSYNNTRAQNEVQNILNGQVQTDTKSLRDVVANIKQQLESAVTAGFHGLGDKLFGSSTRGIQDASAAMQDYSAALDQVKAKEQAVGKVQSLVQRYFSIYAAVRMVTKGIRSMMNNIKELDKTITEIAIVTKMDQSDLWGQMPQYTKLAKNYAASISGVYKVSQLYYQQGLGQQDVMALTEQTLKMARISGLDYSEATDYMTNAVRSFKMEMTDAAKVVDVYSSVAASSASSVTELATAMSKTASSAAAVGSSFENTTAMLAVMIEATRESPENIGSAMKSIISRYGELKENKTGVDSEGEEYSLNKVDKALQTVGISIHDVNGEFRDFDDVIFELSKKWNTIDKNTQRYIATVMAGNRQQSRFLALVSSSDRLEEEREKAANSEDASQLQFLKTMDSIEAKTQQFQTSLQSLYTSSGLENLYKGLLDFGNEFANTLENISSKHGLVGAISNVGASFLNMGTFATTGFSMIKSKLTSTKMQMEHFAKNDVLQGKINQNTAELQALRSNPVSSSFFNEEGELVSNPEYQKQQERIATLEADNKKLNQDLKDGNIYQSSLMKQQEKMAKVQGWGMAASAAGMALQTWANTIDINENRGLKGGLTAGSSALQGLGTGLMVGASAGGPIGALVGTLTALPGVLQGFGMLSESTTERVQKLEKNITEATNERIKSKDELKTLEEYKKKYDELNKTQYESTEKKKEFVELSNTIASTYPELIKSMDAEGNYIVNMTEGYEKLAKAKREAYKKDIVTEMGATISGLEDIDYVIKNVYGQELIQNKRDWTGLVGQEWEELLKLDYTSDQSAAVKNKLSSGLVIGNAPITAGTLFSQEGIESLKTIHPEMVGSRSQFHEGELYHEITSSGGDFLTQLYMDFLDQMQGDSESGREGVDLSTAQSNLIEKYGKQYKTLINGFDTDFYKQLQLYTQVPNYQKELIHNRMSGYTSEYINLIADSADDVFDIESTDLTKRFAKTQLQDEWDKEYDKLKAKQDAGETVDWSTEISNFYKSHEEFWYSLQLESDELKGIDSQAEEFYKTLGQHTKKDIEDLFPKIDESGLQGEALEAAKRNNEIAEKRRIFFKKIYEEDYNDIINNYNNWLKDENKAQFKIQDYSDKVGADYLTQIQSQYKNILSNTSLSEEQIAAQIEALNAITDIITDQDLDFETRNTLLTKYSTADFTSLQGLYAFIDEIKNTDIDIDKEGLIKKVQSLGSVLSINFEAEIDSYYNAIETSIEDFNKAIKSATEGMDLKTAREMADKMGKGLNEFEVINGKFYFRDFETLKEAYIKDNDEFIADLQKQVNDRYSVLEELGEITYKDTNNNEQKTGIDVQQLLKKEVNMEDLNAAFNTTEKKRGFLNATGFTYETFSKYYEEFLNSEQTNFLDFMMERVQTSLDESGDAILAYYQQNVARSQIKSGDIKGFLTTIGLVDSKKDIVSKITGTGVVKLNDEVRSNIQTQTEQLAQAAKENNERLLAMADEAFPNLDITSDTVQQKAIDSLKSEGMMTPREANSYIAEQAKRFEEQKTAKLQEFLASKKHRSESLDYYIAKNTEAFKNNKKAFTQEEWNKRVLLASGKTKYEDIDSRTIDEIEDALYKGGNFIYDEGSILEKSKADLAEAKAFNQAKINEITNETFDTDTALAGIRSKIIQPVQVMSKSVALAGENFLKRIGFLEDNGYNIAAEDASYWYDQVYEELAPKTFLDSYLEKIKTTYGEEFWTQLANTPEAEYTEEQKKVLEEAQEYQAADFIKQIRQGDYSALTGANEQYIGDLYEYATSAAKDVMSNISTALKGGENKIKVTSGNLAFLQELQGSDLGFIDANATLTIGNLAEFDVAKIKATSDETFINYINSLQADEQTKREWINSFLDVKYPDKAKQINSLASIDKTISRTDFQSYLDALNKHDDKEGGKLKTLEDYAKEYGLAFNDLTNSWDIVDYDVYIQALENDAELLNKSSEAYREAKIKIDETKRKHENQKAQDQIKAFDDVIKNYESISDDQMTSLQTALEDNWSVVAQFFTATGTGDYRLDVAKLRNNLDFLGLSDKVKEAILGMFTNTADAYLKNITDAADMVTKGTSSQADMEEFRKKAQNLGVDATDAFTYVAEENAWMLDANVMRKFVEAQGKQLLEAGLLKPEEFNEWLNKNTEKALGESVDILSYLEKETNTAESKQTLKRQIVNAGVYETGYIPEEEDWEVIYEQNKPTTQTYSPTMSEAERIEAEQQVKAEAEKAAKEKAKQNAEKNKKASEAYAERLIDDLSSGGFAAVEALVKIASQTGKELTSADIEKVYRAKASKLTEAFEQLESGVGTVISGETIAIFEKAKVSIEKVGDGTTAIITGFSDIAEVYKQYYDTISQTNGTTLAELNEAYAKVLETQDSRKQEQAAINALGEAQGMTFDTLGTMFTEAGISLAQYSDYLTDSGIIEAIGGNKLRIKDFTSFAKLMNWDFGSEEYISAFKSYNDGIIELNRKTEKSITEELKSLESAKPGELINLTDFFTQLTSSRQWLVGQGWDAKAVGQINTNALKDIVVSRFNNILVQYGAYLEDGILHLEQGASLLGVAQSLKDAAKTAGMDLQEGFDELADVIQNILKSYAEAITKGIEGGLSNAEAGDLRKKAKDLGVDNISFVETTEGLDLATGSAYKLYAALKNIDALSATLVFDKLNSSLEEANEKYKSIGSIQQRIVELQAKTDEANKDVSTARKEEYQAELDLAKEILAVRSTKEDAGFNFMSNKIPGAQNNPINYYNNWADAFGKLKAAMNTTSVTHDYKTKERKTNRGLIDYQDWYNIVTEMNNLATEAAPIILSSAIKLDGSAEAAANLIQKGAEALTVDSNGQVKVALGNIAGLGLDFKTGAADMAAAVDDGIHNLAESQVHMLDGLIALLESIVAFEKLGDIDEDGLGIDLSDLFKLNVEGDPDKGIQEFTAGYEKWRADIANKIKEYQKDPTKNKELVESLQKIKLNLNGKDFSLADMIQWEEDDFNNNPGVAKAYAALVGAMVKAAQSGNYDLDNITASVQQELAASGIFDQAISIDVGENTTLIFSGVSHAEIKWDDEEVQKLLNTLGENGRTKITEAMSKWTTGIDLGEKDLLYVLTVRKKITINDKGDVTSVTVGKETKEFDSNTSLEERNAWLGAAALEERGFDAKDINIDDKISGKATVTKTYKTDRKVNVIGDEEGTHWHSDATGEDYASEQAMFDAEYKQYADTIDAAKQAAGGDGSRIVKLKEEQWIYQKYGIRAVITSNITDENGEKFDPTNDAQLRSKLKSVRDSLNEENIKDKILDSGDGNFVVDLGDGFTLNLDGAAITDVNGKPDFSKAYAEICKMLGADQGLIDNIQEGISKAFEGDKVKNAIGEAFGQAFVGEDGLPISSIKLNPENLILADGTDTKLQEAVTAASSELKARVQADTEKLKADVAGVVLPPLTVNVLGKYIGTIGLPGTLDIKKGINKGGQVSGQGERATGNIGLAKAAGTLMGELGPELVVSNGHYFVAGQNGPEMIDLANDAIVFNHLQTKSLLEKGMSSGRGHAVTNERKATAFANGNVDLNNRKLIPRAIMEAAGWDIGDDNYATVLTNTMSSAPEAEYQMVLNVTPITPEGKVLTEGALVDYVEGYLLGDGTRSLDEVLELDKNGLGLIIDSEEVKENMDEVIETYVQAADTVHNEQAAIYNEMAKTLTTPTENEIEASVISDAYVAIDEEQEKKKIRVMPRRKTRGETKAKGTLMGELGPELVVSNGKYFLVGQDGAEFVDLDPDAIVFNHKQTASLFSKGKSGRGVPFTNENAAISFAKGSVHGGPAMASAAAALAALKQLRAQWQALAGMSAQDLAGKGGGGGGGGGDPKAFIHLLERWYNYLQKIAQLEKQISYEESKRTTYASSFARTGADYFKSQVNSLDYLKQELQTQIALNTEQEKYFNQRQQELAHNSAFKELYQINQNGQLEYVPGAFEKLSELSGRNPVTGEANLSAEEQYNRLVAMGYNDQMLFDSSGNEIKHEGNEWYATAVQAFWDKVENERQEMQELHDSVEEGKKKSQELQNQQNEILKEIEENQIAVEQKVLKAVEEERQRKIDDLKEEREALEEASQHVIDGLSDQLQKEQDMYQQQQDTDELAKLQRQLAIMQRSGGSASQIADLQQQIAEKQQDMYFDIQQKQIDALQEASDAQLERLDHQIDIMTEQLEYEKENGLLWNRVSEILEGSPEDISTYIQQNTKEYWGKSTTDLAKTLREDLFEIDRFKEQAKSVGGIESLLGYVYNEEMAQVEAEQQQKENEEYIKGLYKELLGREGEEAGIQYWMQQMQNGQTKDQIREGFMNSKEYKKLHGIQETVTPTTTTTTQSAEKRYGVWQNKKTGRWYAGESANGEFTSWAAAQKERDKRNGEITPKVEGKPVQAAKGGLINEPTITLVGETGEPEVILNPEQTRILRDNILSSRPDSLVSLLKSYKEAYHGLSQSTYDSISNNSNQTTIERAEVNLHIEKLADDYDSKRAANTIMDEMLRIAAKQGATSSVRR